MKLFFFVIWLTLLSAIYSSSKVYGQRSANVESINSGYFGHLGVHPGLYGSLDYRLTEKLKVKNKKKGEKIISKGWMLNPSLSYYHHFGNQNMFIAGVDLARKKQSSKSYFREYGFGPRLMAGFNAGETFDALDINSEPYKKRLAASYNFGLSTHYFIGWKLNRKSTAPLGVYFGPQVIWVFDYNQTVVPSTNFILGVKKSINVKQ